MLYYTNFIGSYFTDENFTYIPALPTVREAGKLNSTKILLL